MKYNAFFVFFSGAINITQSPQDVWARVNETVTFRCEYTGTRDLPRWRIDGTDYSVIDLPPGHRYTFGGLQVRLQDVYPLRNKTEYSCFFYEFITSCGLFRRVQSSPGVLFIERSELHLFQSINPCICEETSHKLVIVA